jgi:hypothetical protein
MHTVEERLAHLDEIDAMLTKLLECPAGLDAAGMPLRSVHLDGYMAGVERYNSERENPGDHAGVHLTNLCSPPRWILEAPSDATLGWSKKPYTFNSLWDKHVKVEIAFARWMVQRYLTRCNEMRGQALAPALVSIGMGNEPDCEWLPDEVRIEKSHKPEANALAKYVTEMHLQQILEGIAPMMAYEKTG